MESKDWVSHLENWRRFLYQRLEKAEGVGDKVKIERQLRAIEFVKYSAVANPRLLTEFISLTEEIITNQKIDEFFLKLNKNQKLAVERAVFDNVLTLIQGPPGTGKTQVIAEICLQLYKQNPNVKILVCSETHIAVNNLISRISEYNDDIKIVRVRDNEQNVEIEKFYVDSIINGYFEWLDNSQVNDEFKNIIMDTFQDSSVVSIEKAVALSANIVGMTCNRVFAYSFDTCNEIFDVVIIDEVCKATLPEILMPLVVAKKAILVGDPEQLPPVFCSEEIELIKSIENCDLQRYMYIDKLFINSKNKIMLNTQYRMENEIGSLISNLFYFGKLENGRKISYDESILWIDYVPTKEWPPISEDAFENQRIYNLDECQIIMDELEEINENSEKLTSVGVIAPYKVSVKNLVPRKH